jgi:hypothetical protein
MVCSEKLQRLSMADETPPPRLPPQPWLWDALAGRCGPPRRYGRTCPEAGPGARA